MPTPTPHGNGRRLTIWPWEACAVARASARSSFRIRRWNNSYFCRRVIGTSRRGPAFWLKCWVQGQAVSPSGRTERNLVEIAFDAESHRAGRRRAGQVIACRWRGFLVELPPCPSVDDAGFDPEPCTRLAAPTTRSGPLDRNET